MIRRKNMKITKKDIELQISEGKKVIKEMKKAREEVERLFNLC